MKILSILQPSFLPYLGYIDLIEKCDQFIFYDHVQFDKNSWRNRNRILINNIPSWITVPIVRDKLSKKIFETRIYDPEKNFEKIKKKIFYNYKNHPNFENFSEKLLFIFNKKEIFLSSLNIELTKIVLDELKIKFNYIKSSDYDNLEDKNLNIINWCKNLECKIYYTGQSAKNYINVNLFKKNGIDVKFQNFIHPVYKQKNVKKFVPNLSVIDYIFNLEK